MSRRPRPGNVKKLLDSFVRESSMTTAFAIWGCSSNLKQDSSGVNGFFRRLRSKSCFIMSGLSGFWADFEITPGGQTILLLAHGDSFQPILACYIKIITGLQYRFHSLQNLRNLQPIKLHRQNAVELWSPFLRHLWSCYDFCWFLLSIVNQ